MLNLTNITKLFPGQCMPTINNLNLEVTQGEFCVVLGNNGSGKSTLLRCIAGEHSIDSGKISIHNQDVTRQNRSRFIASVTQDINTGTIADMTLLENMVLSQMRCRAASCRFYKQRHRAAIITALKELNLGLDAYIDEPMNSLSGGQRQIIATLMAITSKPQILLLDEHTSALDPNTQSLLMQYTANNIGCYKITTMMITHKLEMAMHYGNRLLVINKGSIVLDVKGSAKKEFGAEKLLGFFGGHTNEQ